MSSSDLLAQRYGRGPRRGLRLFAIYAGVIVLGLVAWFCWAMWSAMHPEVSSKLQNWEAVDDNTVSLTYQVNLHDEDAGPITCSVEAEDAHETPVGRLTDFETEPGRFTVEVTTERRAYRMEWVGCTTPGQDSPK